MAGDWKVHRVGDIAAAMGDAPFGSLIKNHDYTDGGALVVQGKNIQGRTCDWSDRRYVSHQKYESLRRSHCMVGDLVFPKVGTIGKVGILTACPGVDEYVLSTNTMRFRADPTVATADYVYYFFTWSETVNLIHALNSNSVQPVFNFTSLKNFEIPLPSLAEQKSIAAVLGALDDKIELNRRMNATLEAIARALFQSWFVDFDPVRAKLEGRQTADLDEATVALFPASFQDSPLGPIPHGWEARPLSEIVDVVKGRSYRSEELAASKTALVTLKSFLRGGGYRIDGLKPFTGEYKPNQRVRPGELVVAFTDVTQAADVIGKPALIRSDDRFETLVASLDVGIVRPKSKHASIPFLYCLFLTAEFQAHTYSHVTGTTVLHLGSTAIPSFLSITPPVVIAEKFAERADQIFRLIDENAKQSRTLATLRDTLLPKLLSGELDVISRKEEGAA